MKTHVYRPLGGTHIDTACLHAALMAKANGCLVRFTFNGVRLVASPKKSDVTLHWE